jgi:hypothetical protein
MRPWTTTIRLCRSGGLLLIAGATLANIGGVTKRVTTIGKRLKAFGY